jgi:hypothetical protein
MADQEQRGREKKNAFVSPHTFVSPHKCPAERERLSQQGEAWSLYDSLSTETGKGTSIRWHEEFARLSSALQTSARDMPERFAAEIFSEIMSSATYLWARTSFHLERCIQEFDEHHQCRSGSQLSQGVVHELMPRLLKLGAYIGEMAQIQAATARQWALARDKSPQEQPATQPARKKRVRAKTPAESQPAVDVATDVRTNGTNGAHPPTTSVALSDPRIADVVNDGPGHLPAAAEN